MVGQHESHGTGQRRLGQRKNDRVSVVGLYGTELQRLTSTSRTVTPPGILAVVSGGVDLEVRGSFRRRSLTSRNSRRQLAIEGRLEILEWGEVLAFAPLGQGPGKVTLTLC